MRYAALALVVLVGSCTAPAARRVARSFEVGVTAGQSSLEGDASGARADGDLVAVTASIHPLEFIEPDPVRLDLPRPVLEGLTRPDPRSAAALERLEPILARLESLLAAQASGAADDPSSSEGQEAASGAAPAGGPWDPQVVAAMVALISAAATALGVKTGHVSRERRWLVGPKAEHPARGAEF